MNKKRWYASEKKVILEEFSLMILTHDDARIRTIIMMISDVMMMMMMMVMMNICSMCHKRTETPSRKCCISVLCLASSGSRNFMYVSLSLASTPFASVWRNFDAYTQPCAK